MIVIGIGNSLRSDDNIGNYLAEKVGGLVGESNPENLIGKVAEMHPDTIVFIDAVEFSEKVGEVKLFALDDIADQLSTTHSIPVGVFKRIMPHTEIKVIGVQVKNREVGREFSLEMKQCLPQVEEMVKAIISSLSK